MRRRTLLLTVLLAVTIFAASSLAGVEASNKPPKQPEWTGYWVCWYKSQAPVCGSYGWSKSRSYARKLALEKCWEACWEHRPCQYEYCERMK